MNHNRAFAYGFLAYIHETNENFKDFSDIFVPLVKRVLSELYANGTTKGILDELKKAIDNKYGLDMPYPMVKKITQKIAKEYNNNNAVNFQAFENDGSFIMRNYIFADYEDDISAQEQEIDLIQAGFETYLQSKGVKLEKTPSIYAYIEKNKQSLSKFFAHKNENINNEETELLQADFLRSVKEIPNMFNPLKRVYLGSIIASYLELKFENLPDKIEFVLDTNFVISLINLNSTASFHTCKKIVEICTQMGHKLSVLQDTINETKNLLMRCASEYETSFLAKKIDEESVYGACDRNKYGRTDLERIAHNFQEDLTLTYQINILPHTETYQNKAKYSKEYEILKEREKKQKKQGFLGALHDATVIEYVKAKRDNRYVANFEDAKCWFVNSISDMPYLLSLQKGNQGNVIKAEDLVNRLWLSNPSVIPSSEIAELGLSRLISGTISNATPSAKTLKKLDDKFQKYAKQNNISDKECARVAMALSEKTIENLKLVDDLSQINDEVAFAEKINFTLKEYEKKEQLEEERRQQFIEQIKNEVDEKLKQHTEESKKRTDEQKVNYEKSLKRQERDLKRKSDEELFKKEQENYENLTRAYRTLNEVKKSIEGESSKTRIQSYILLTVFFLLTFIGYGVLSNNYVFVLPLPFIVYVSYLIFKYGISVFKSREFKDKIKRKIFEKRNFNYQDYKDLENKITKSKNIIDGIPTVLVEGKSDEIIIKEVIKLFAPNLHTFVAVRCNFDDTGGATWLKDETIRFIEQGNTKIFSIFDDDDAGSQKYNPIEEKLKNYPNTKIKVIKGYFTKPKHITSWLSKDVKIPIALEEMYSGASWNKAKELGFLEKRSADEISLLCQDYKKWDKGKQNVSELLKSLENNEAFIFLENKVKKSSKISFANHISSMNETEKNEALQHFKKLAEEIETFFNQ
ncbi:hypothetical protein [Hugenholtzia roseola]|uniref:hypothetical protein n=1 Tax=Hugenholtzia roseola TaxID=1002 RepID=UPI000410F9FF|nr:hypothetical protein [Hugenholtzia roseola]